MYVRMYVRTYVCTYVCMYVFFMFMYVIYVYTHAYMHMCIYIQTDCACVYVTPHKPRRSSELAELKEAISRPQPTILTCEVAVLCDLDDCNISPDRLANSCLSRQQTQRQAVKVAELGLENPFAWAAEVLVSLPSKDKSN